MRFCAALQKHHGAREVFLTQQADANCAASFLRKCRVCTPDDYEDCNSGTEDVDANNVYLCEYDYDNVWQVTAPCPLVLHYEIWKYSQSTSRVQA